MTAADDTKAKLHDALATIEGILDEAIDANAPASDPAGDPPSDSPPADNDPPVDPPVVIDPPVNDPPVVVTPPVETPPANDPPLAGPVDPAPIDLGMFRIVGLNETGPDQNSVGGKTVVVPTGYSRALWSAVSNPSFPSSEFLSQPTDPGDGTVKFVEQHSTGQAVVLPKSGVALFVTGKTINTIKTLMMIWPNLGSVYLSDGVTPYNAGSQSSQTPAPVQTPTPVPTITPSLPPVLVGPVEPGAAMDPAKFVAVITPVGGSPVSLSGAKAEDLGDQVVAFCGITQKNFAIASPDGLFTVFFRPDADSARWEYVVRYGNPLNAAPATSGAYAIDVLYDGKPLDHQDVDHHFWLARWRIFSSPRPRARRPSDIIGLNLVPSYKASARPVALPQAAPAYTIMGHSNITTFMGETGERDDIGINPESTAAYLATEDATAYANMMEWAECSGTGPWHLDDPSSTGHILNWDNYPLANLYNASSSKPPVYVMKALTNGDPLFNEFIRPDGAHHPCLSYVPFLTTGDPYHAEELQYQINFYLGGENNNKGVKQYIFDLLQTRGYAWMLRSVVFAYLAADLISSPTLLSKAYWKKALDNNAAWLVANCVNSVEPRCAVFSCGPSVLAMGWWQEDYFMAVLGAMQRLGVFSDWKPIFDWKLKTNKSRLNGISGWDGASPLTYYTQFVKQEMIANPANVGNGTMVYDVIGRADPYSYVGDTICTFVSATQFNLTDENGEPFNGPTQSGTVGAVCGSGYVPNFTVIAGDKPFQPGDVLTRRISKIATWGDLWDYNVEQGIAFPSNGAPLIVPNGEAAYAGSLYAAMSLASSIDTEAAPLFDKFAVALANLDQTLSWRNSFAA